jgi:K+-transporting ATPase ATPase C chain
MNATTHTLVTALRATLVTLVLTGIAYPLAVTGVAQVIFPTRANGSLVTDDKGAEVGSELIGQAFASPEYLQGRPSANGYDGSNSGGTNLGTTSKKLREGQADDPATKDVDESFTGAQQLAADFRTANGLPAGAIVPADAVTRSASGLDPDVSPETAALQAARIARARGVDVARVQAVIAEHTDGRDLGLFGEPHVNVLVTNLALDRLFGRPAHLAGDGATMTR